MKTNFSRIIFIDDDSIHNSIAAQFVKKHLKGVDVEVIKFSKPTEALEYVRHEQAHNPVKTIIFLDINMPVKSGWDVLGELSSIKESMKKNVIIYMLSSSVSIEDRIRALQNDLVTDYFEKPLIDHLSKIFSSTATAVDFHI